jgi:hypothetical protein
MDFIFLYAGEVFFFKQMTADEIHERDFSSDVRSADLGC